MATLNAGRNENAEDDSDGSAETTDYSGDDENDSSSEASQRNLDDNFIQRLKQLWKEKSNPNDDDDNELLTSGDEPMLTESSSDEHMEVSQEQYDAKFAKMWEWGVAQRNLDNKFPSREQLNIEIQDENYTNIEWFDFPVGDYEQRKNKYTGPNDLKMYIDERRRIETHTKRNGRVFIPIDENFMFNMVEAKFKELTNQINEKTKAGCCIADGKVFPFEGTIEICNLEYILHEARFSVRVQPSVISPGPETLVIRLNNIAYYRKRFNKFYCRSCTFSKNCTRNLGLSTLNGILGLDFENKHRNAENTKKESFFLENLKKKQLKK